MNQHALTGIGIGFFSYFVYFFGCDQREPQTRPVREAKTGRPEATLVQGGLPELAWSYGRNLPVNDRDDAGFTPLMRAAIYDRIALAELLIDHGAPLEARDREGRTPLHLAILNDSAVFDLLLARGARTDAADSAGELPLHYAIRLRRHRAFDRLMLLAGPGDLDRANQAGLTPLTMALAAKVPSMVVRLVEAGADVNLANSSKVTPLMLAANGGRRSTPELVRLLVDRGARLEAEDSMGRTAIFYSVGKIWVDTTSLLLEARAGHLHRDNTGRGLRDYLTGDGERADRDRILCMLDAIDRTDTNP